MSDDFPIDPDDRMLPDSLVKARRLVSELEKQQSELLASPPTDLPPQKLAEGKQAMENALASARRMLKALEEAVVIRVQAESPSGPHRRRSRM